MNAYENNATETQAYEALRLAQVSIEKALMVSSAKHCAIEAERFFNAGQYGFAHEWAIQSLRYSVGIFHESFKRLLAERAGA